MQRSPYPRWRIYYAVVLVLLYLPILLLVVFSFNDATSLVFPLRGFTLQWYADLSQNQVLLGAVGNSIRVGLVSSAAATALGAMGAFAMLRYQLPGRSLFLAVSMLPLVIPYLILGAALLILFKELGLTLSVFTAGLAHVVVSTPYAMLIIGARLAGFPKNLEEAAMDLGASYSMALLRVTLPICSPALLAAFLLCFTISFDEYSISSFLAGTDTTLPIYLYSQLRFPTRLPMVVALASILMATTISVALLRDRLRRVGQVRPLNA